MTDEQALDLPPFAAFVASQRSGEMNTEATVAFAEVVRSVAALGKPGKLTVTVQVAPVRKGQPGDQVIISDSVQGRPPTEDTSAFWFVTDDGGVTRRDPRQSALWDSEVGADE